MTLFVLRRLASAHPFIPEQPAVMIAKMAFFLLPSFAMVKGDRAALSLTDPS